jgi:aconitate hydratase
VMTRGTFAHRAIFNKFIGEKAPKTKHIPSGKISDVFDVAKMYAEEQRDLVVLAGTEYGIGPSRDWAAKGSLLLGIRVVLAESYERIHRANLVGMGVLPLQYLDGENASLLGLSGEEKFSVDIPDNFKPNQVLEVRAGKLSFQAIARFETELEVAYYENGGILNYMIRQMID